MNDERLVRQPSFVDQVYKIIVQGISNGTYPTGGLLPSENQLAESLNVSRPTIRAAFARLLTGGYVTRKRGIGTFVTNIPSVVNPLYRTRDIAEWITTRGFTAGFKQINGEIIPADSEISDTLEIDIGSNVVNIYKIFTADEKPIIFFINYIPEWVYQESLSVEETLAEGATEPFFEFFAVKCKTQINFLNSIIYPEIVKNCDLPEPFNIYQPNNPVLVIKDIGYGESDNPVFLSYEFLFGEASTFPIVRRVENI